MPRGGYRERAGRKSTWKSGCSFAETKLIRVPARIADKVLEFAHKLDSEESLDLVSNSNPSDELQPDEPEINPDQLSLFGAVILSRPKYREVGVASGLSGRALAKRLKVSSGTLQAHKKKDSPLAFAQWTKSNDFEGWSWEYDSGTKLYYPIPPGS